MLLLLGKIAGQLGFEAAEKIPVARRTTAARKLPVDGKLPLSVSESEVVVVFADAANVVDALLANCSRNGTVINFFQSGQKWPEKAV